VNRRAFLASSAALAAGALGAQERTPVVDGHVHCFAGTADPRFPYHAQAPYRPEAPATPEHLLRLMDEAGVDHAVVVHPEPYQDDHRYLAHCLEVGRGRLKGTVLFFADRPGWEAALKEAAKTLPVVAARVHAYAPDRLPPFGKPELRALWKSAVDLGLAVQIHFEPRYAAGFEPYLDEFRSTVIVDHLGRPLQGTPEEHERVVRWAEKYPHTVMKLSQFAPTTSYPHRDITPIVRRLADAYGADRMVYGGGYDAGATAESYRATRERARALVAHLSPADQAKVLGGTARRLFRL